MSSLAPEVSSGGHNSKPEKTVPLSRGDGSRRSKRVGRHRKEDPSGNIFFKKAPQDHISGALQLGITHSVGAHQVDRDVLLQGFLEFRTLNHQFLKTQEFRNLAF